MEQNRKFMEFINARFIAWEQERGQRGTVTEFAEALGPGTYQGDVSHWMKGTRIPGVKVLQKLANNPLIGPEVWEAAGYGYLVKDPTLIRTLSALESLPRPMQEYFANQAEKSAREHERGETFSFQAAA